MKKKYVLDAQSLEGFFVVTETVNKIIKSHCEKNNIIFDGECVTFDMSFGKDGKIYIKFHIKDELHTISMKFDEFLHNGWSCKDCHHFFWKLYQPCCYKDKKNHIVMFNPDGFCSDFKLAMTCGDCSHFNNDNCFLSHDKASASDTRCFYFDDNSKYKDCTFLRTYSNGDGVHEYCLRYGEEKKIDCIKKATCPYKICME